MERPVLLTQNLVLHLLAYKQLQKSLVTLP